MLSKSWKVILGAKVLKVAALAVYMLWPVQAEANDWRNGLYIKGSTGLTKVHKQEYGGLGSKVSVHLDDGFNVGGAVGYQAGNLRGELEMTYRESNVEKVKMNDVNMSGKAGSLNSYAWMGNVYYDFDGLEGFVPYVGAGIGVARVDAKRYAALGVPEVKGRDTVFAYQAMLGLEVPLDSRVSLYGEYKYFATQDIEVRSNAGDKHDLKNRSHNIALGVRYQFD